MISKGNHVKFARFVLLVVSEEAKTFFFLKNKLDEVFVDITKTSFFFHSMYNETIFIIRFGFSDIQNNQGLGKDYQPKLSALADNPYLDLDYSGYHKYLIQ